MTRKPALLAASFILAALTVSAQTQIQDLYYAPNGQFAQGTLTITNPAFTTAASVPVPAATMVVPITNGVVNVTLSPTVGSSPATTYTATWSITNSNVGWTESWNVPVSATPVRVQQVRVGGTVSITLGQINATGLTVGDCLEVATGPVIAAVACGSGGISQLTGDVTAGPGTGSQVATVASVGGSTAANVHSAELAANAATNTNTPGAIVKRDASGNFTAGTVTANLTGTASGNELPLTFGLPLVRSGNAISCPTASSTQAGCLASADWTAFNSKQASLGFTPLNPANNLSDVANVATARSNLGLSSAGGDLSGAYPNPLVATVGTSTAANIHTAEVAANSATNLDTASTIVKRDASGNFAAGTITGALTGVASGNELPLTFQAPLTRSTNTISMPAATASSNGYLLSTDWSTFNQKQNALGFTPLNPANNLSDLASAITARTNLGVAIGTNVEQWSANLDAWSAIAPAAKQNAITTGTTLQYLRGDLSLATFPTSLPPSGAAGGDLSGTFPGPTVAKVNGAAVPLSASVLGSNASGQIVANTGTLTNNISGNAATATAVAGSYTAGYVYAAPASVAGALAPRALVPTDIPVLNQNTTGTAANVTGVVARANGGLGTSTAGTGILRDGATPAASELSGDATTAGSNVVTVKGINGVNLAGLGTGILKNTTGTGAPSIAVPADFPTLNQNTTGNAATATAIAGSFSPGLVLASPAATSGALAARALVPTDIPTLNQSTTGNAATATAFATAPAVCPAGQYATGITSVGAGICSQVGYSQLSGAPALYYQNVQSGGSAMTQRGNLNFSSNFAVTDVSASNRTSVDLASTISSNISGNAATASQLLGTPTLCASGFAPTGIAANGAAVNCTALTTGVMYAVNEGPALSWTVSESVHGLGTHFHVATYDTAGNEITGNVSIDTYGNVTVSWLLSQSGQLILSK